MEAVVTGSLELQCPKEGMHGLYLPPSLSHPHCYLSQWFNFALILADIYPMQSFLLKFSRVGFCCLQRKTPD